MKLHELKFKPYEPRPVGESILYKMGYQQALEDIVIVAHKENGYSVTLEDLEILAEQLKEGE